MKLFWSWGGRSRSAIPTARSRRWRIPGTTTRTDARNRQRKSTVDALGRLTAVTEDPNGTALTTSHGYDVLDDLVAVNQSGQQRSFVYDSLGWLVAANNPENASAQSPASLTCGLTMGLYTTCYGYDADGNLQTKTDNRQVTTTYTYDSVNRIKSKTYTGAGAAATTAVSYSYDAAGVANGVVNGVGRLSAVSNGLSTTSYTAYDALGRVTASTQTAAGQAGYTFGYTYNLAGALKSETYPSGRVVTTGYDGANRASSVTGQLGTQQTPYLTNAVYAAHGGMQRLFYGNTVDPAMGYNARLQPCFIATAINSDPKLFLWAATYDWGTGNNNPLVCNFTNSAHPQTDNGSLQAVAEQYGNGVAGNDLATLGQSYSYDGVNRLHMVTDSGYARTFNYDQFGNSWVTANSGVALAGTTPTSNVYSNNQVIAGNYDANGNQLVVNGDTLTYDAENRQVTATEPAALGGGTETYVYDGLGQRVQKSGPGGTTTYVYDALGRLAAEYGANTGVSPCRQCYFTWDHLGTVRLVTDEKAQVVGFHDYLPFGEEIPAGLAGRSTQFGDGKDGVNQKFTGQERDQETGEDYFQARYYGAALGRFLSPDPVGMLVADPMNPQSWNAYSYVRNNPLSATDPSGMFVSAHPFSPDPEEGNEFYLGECDSFCFDAQLYGRGYGMQFYAGLQKSSGGGTSSSGNNNYVTAAPVKTGNTFTKTFLPKGYYLSCGAGNQAFLAPTVFNINKIEAAGKANGLNPFAINANVGHYGTFDYQRSRDSAANTTFYSGFTNVSNFDVGVYMQSAGYSRAATSAIANGFALLKSSNFGDQLQALFRNLGFDTAAKGATPACTIEVYY